MKIGVEILGNSTLYKVEILHERVQLFFYEKC